MALLRVRLKKRVDYSYGVEISAGAREILIEDLVKLKGVGRKFAVITDGRVAKSHGMKLVKDLKKKKLECDLFSFSAGEASKKMDTVLKIVREMLKKKYNRGDMVVALGGGVTGDMAGFVAAVFMRGIDFVQVPTSLLAMTDAAIGGKTGVNVPEGKNLLGAFYQPKKVYVDVNFLKSLPKSEIQNGYAEIVKHAVISDKKLFKMLEEASDKQLFDDLEFLNRVLVRSCAVKTGIVSRDERESKLRMKLNLGHTIGHAVEKEMNYKIDHGKAVAIGLAKICDLAVKKRLLAERHARRIKNLLEHIGLPTELPGKISKERLVEAMTGDKKVLGKRIHFVVPRKIGRVDVTDRITLDEVKTML